ncbi:MAG: tetratricopeptide repeat protein [Phycisphaerae bacterium]|nr:tetratricopeptide repeat protein [Phycisphaerae bacterium]
MQGILRIMGTVFLGILAGCASAPPGRAEAMKPARQPLTTLQRDSLLSAVKSIQAQTDQGQHEAVRAAFDQLKKDLPQIAAFDLRLFALGEVHLARHRNQAAARAFQKVVDDYPESELRTLALTRLFQIGTGFLEGPVTLDLIVYKVRGTEQGMAILDKVSEEVGLDDPNGLGVRAAVAVAHMYERQGKHEEACLRWREIAAVWGTGPLGRDALLGMAENKLAAYNRHPPHRRPLYDGANLTEARTYYLRFKDLYPQDANQIDVDRIVQQIDQDMAHKQLGIARYYQRTGRDQAARLYYDMVVRSWPDTQAAQLARESLLAQSPAPTKDP